MTEVGLEEEEAHPYLNSLFRFGTVQGQGMRFHFLPLLVLCLLKLKNTRAWGDDEEEITECLVKDEIKFINTLGFKIQNLVIAHPGNSFISPVGIAYSLGIIHLGAAGATAQQLEDILISKESSFSFEKFHRGMKSLRDDLQSNGRNFSVFSGFFIQEGCDVNTEFSDNIKKFYEAETFEVNFANDSEFSAEDINDYARNKTNGKFEAVLTERVPNITQSLLLNAVDFNDAWKVQFPQERTKRDYFYSGKRETTQVWMMSTEVETFKFYEDLEIRYKFLELPYKDDKMSMILALPIQYDQPANLQIDGNMLCDIKSKMISTKLDMVSIPRMKFQFQTNLKEVLIDVGVKDIFDPFVANFSGICYTKDFHIGDIVQKTLVEVDEEGNNAATITKFKFLPLAFRGVKEFIANHPFQFFVQDKLSGVILFSGRVDEPSESISLAENLRFT